MRGLSLEMDFVHFAVSAPGFAVFPSEGEVVEPRKTSATAAFAAISTHLLTAH
jgi:hypothetical protein